MFKITITETKPVKKIIGKQWVKVGEVARDDRYLEKDEPKTRMKDVMGYSPEVESIITQERQVLIQEVEDMDLISVIKAINKIGPIQPR